MTDGPMHRLLRVVRRIAAPDAGPLSDERLLERFVATGDEAAFELLVRRHGAMVLGVCRRALRDDHAAEDAFQATFCVLARKARAVTNVAGYLHSVAGRVAANERRKTARRAWHERRAAVAEVITPNGADADVRAVIDEELERLPARFRLPVVLCYLEGHTTTEAARQLGCPRGTVLSRLAAARLKLKARLTRRGLALPAGGLAAALAVPSEAPAVLVGPAVRTALAFAAGRTILAGAAAPEVITLAEGVLRAMIVSKLKMAAAVVLAVGVLGTGVGWVARPTVGPGPAFAEAPQPPAKAGATTVADRHGDDQPRDVHVQDLQALHDQLGKLTRHLTELEEMTERDRSRLRFELVEAEERLRQVQRGQEFQREMEMAHVKSRVAKVMELREKLDFSRVNTSDAHPATVALERDLVRVSQEREEALDTHNRKEKDRLDELLQARRRLLQAEENLQRSDRHASTQRQPLQAARDTVHAKLVQLEYSAPRAGGADARFDELERKISDLLREVKELRRELRK